MKLLIVYHCGLAEESMSFYREYVNQGIDLTVIVPWQSAVVKNESPSGYLTYSDKYDNKGYTVIPVDLRNPISYGEGFKFFQLFKAIKQTKPDIIHVIDEYASFYLAQTILCRNILYGRKVPVVAYVSQNLPFGPFDLPPFVFKSLRAFFKRILRRIQYYSMFIFQKRYLDGLVGCSNQAIERVRDLGVNMPMHLNYWGVDLKVFHPKNCDLCREKLGIPKDIKLVGYIGRLNKEKGVDKLIRAVNRIDEYCLLLPNYGDYKEEMDKLIDSLGMKDRIYRYDNIKHDELVDYYNAFDVFVLPSQSIPCWQEQYGRVLVEAMGCNVPVIGSSSGAISEVLNGYPRHLIFKEDSVDDLIDKIKKIDELKFPENFNLDKFLYKFSIENFIKKNIKFYKKLLMS